MYKRTSASKEPKVYSLPSPHRHHFPNQSPPSGYFLVSQAGVRVCATKSFTDIDLICKNLMFNQRRVVFYWLVPKVPTGVFMAQLEDLKSQ